MIVVFHFLIPPTLRTKSLFSRYAFHLPVSIWKGLVPPLSIIRVLLYVVALNKKGTFSANLWFDGLNSIWSTLSHGKFHYEIGSLCGIHVIVIMGQNASSTNGSLTDAWQMHLFQLLTNNNVSCYGKNTTAKWDYLMEMLVWWCVLVIQSLQMH